MRRYKITIVGVGYVGLVTGVALSEIGHSVTCLDMDQAKVDRLQAGEVPIYEPGLEELIRGNQKKGRLTFTSQKNRAYSDAEIIYVAVGTPQQEDGTANLSYINQVAKDIASFIEMPSIVVIKSTVPVGTNESIRAFIQKETTVPIRMVSNPEFLREGSAVQDTFYGDRIVIGTDCEEAGDRIEEINKPFGIKIYRTDLRSAELIKYASNAFLATKISFINEIANLSEKVGANVDEVAKGMGMDSRIGHTFLNAGIGYGGSCFPKDTKALVQMAGHVDHDFKLLKSVIEVNQYQQINLVTKAMEKLGSLQGKRIAMLGLAFKPNTDDMREAASIVTAKELIASGAQVIAYDPIAIPNAKNILPSEVQYANAVDEALKRADMAFILTEWKEITQTPLSDFKKWLKDETVFDGRNCYTIEEAKQANLTYCSIGRPNVLRTP